MAMREKRSAGTIRVGNENDPLVKGGRFLVSIACRYTQKFCVM